MADGDVTISIRDRLLKERNALLDLSTRNRLLNTPLRTKNNRAIEIVDEKSSEVFRLLTSNRAFSFVPGVQLSEADRADLDPDDDVTGGIPQPGNDDVDEQGRAARHTDTRLQTRLTSEGLQKRLFDIWYDAQTLEQEQGVNILYLAIGLLRWFDSDSSDVARHAPLVLLPVKLERTSAADKFKLRWRDEPPSPNLTLQAKMKAEFALTIEDFTDEDEVDLAGYCARIAETISNQKRWEVLPDAMVLGFFSFSKFLMYRDLDPDNWPKQTGIDSREMISALLRDGFPESTPLVGDTDAIDDVIRPLELHHVVDADSSQTVAIAEAAGGRSIVVKGPPGTGKSQTITNIIAAAVARGKKVLFVAEKMAALDVVHRRLRQVGLGPLTLELHSNKVNKRTVLEELKRTRDAQHRPPRGDLSVIEKLGETSGALNSFAKRLRKPLQPSGLTPQAILGFLARSQETTAPSGYALTNADQWDREAVATRRAMVAEVAERSRILGPVPANVWRGVQCDALDPTQRQALRTRLQAVAASLADAKRHAEVATEGLAAPILKTMADLQRASSFLSITPLPAGLDRTALASSSWSDLDKLQHLIKAGRTYVSAWEDAEKVFNDAGRTADLAPVRLAVVILGSAPSTSSGFMPSWRSWRASRNFPEIPDEKSSSRNRVLSPAKRSKTSVSDVFPLLLRPTITVAVGSSRISTFSSSRKPSTRTFSMCITRPGTFFLLVASLLAKRHYTPDNPASCQRKMCCVIEAAGEVGRSATATSLVVGQPMMLRRAANVVFLVARQCPFMAHSSRSRCDRQVKTVAPSRPAMRIHRAVFIENFQTTRTVLAGLGQS